MFDTQIKELFNLFFYNNSNFPKGLTDNQINDAQEFYNIKFPPDLKELLMCFCPAFFFDWSNFSKTNVQLLKERLRWPTEGILFDVENNNFWMECWGIKPNHMKTALEIAERNLAAVPPLIPIYSHRYIPSNPCEAGNPIYSVYQTDIIYYGKDIWDYFKVEFDRKPQQSIQFDEIKPDIPFWGELVI